MAKTSPSNHHRFNGLINMKEFPKKSKCHVFKDICEISLSKSVCLK